MPSARAVVFDLDGTLIQSNIDYDEMRKRAMGALAAEGVPPEELGQSRRIWEIITGGERMLRELGMPPERCLQTISRINDELNAVELEALTTVEPTAHVHEALEALRRLGLRIGVATRGCNAYATRSLEMTGLTKYVDAMLARDDVEHPKPDPRHLLQVIADLGVHPKDVVFVGDTTTDMKTAADAGIAFIGFLRNGEWGRRLRDAGCRVLVDDLRAIVELVAGETSSTA